ncbi:hypothetical protein SAMN05444410_101344 [Hydrobacter penzbergensis]|uniref:Uncharacterized protein n=1 Tax=Hydrobacter penzbergensis TaxID=1235997 RepID=A0A8X8LCR5_9BACT|nr:hypothetical protein [Hydrobacter penzbergensis]SDW14658.1 hypothetical protein SAMN05444410_101344 [Hydrobacter penzbergensis]
MTSQLRKLVLTCHIAFSVGWFGAVAGFVVLNIAALTSKNNQTVLSSYIGMNLIGQYIILPFCFGSLITGLIQSLGAKWGLIKHYWVFVKFLLTVGSTILLLVHMRLINDGAMTASKVQLPNSQLFGIGRELLQKAVLALFVLLAITVISVYKPWGKIHFGTINTQSVVMENNATQKASVIKIVIGVIIVLLLFFVVWHLSGTMNHY